MTFPKVTVDYEPELGTNWIFPDGREGAVVHVEPIAKGFRVTVGVLDAASPDLKLCPSAPPSPEDDPRTPQTPLP